MIRKLLYIAIASASCLPALAQTAQPVPDFGALLQATQQQAAQANAAAAEVMGSIGAAMQREQSRAMVGVENAMRNGGVDPRADNPSGRNYATSAGGAGSIYSSDIQYSTYGIDTRRNIEASNNTYNPFLMTSAYAPGDIYAAPAGSAYINRSRGYGYGQARPVPGRQTSGFGWRPSFGRMHRGVDLSLAVGDTVRSAFPGQVVKVGNDPSGYGRYVKVKHADGLETLYGHLSTPIARHGQYVGAGTPLGLGGATGNATGPHLHFETRLNGTAVDPNIYFDFRSGQPRQRTASGSSPSKQTAPAQRPSRQDQQRPQQQTAPRPRPNMRTETVATVSAQSGVQPRTSTYQVRRGDTLEKIARAHGMTVDEICRLNRMSKYTPMYRGKIIRLK